MKMFITELQGRTAMSSDGEILGTIDNVVIDIEKGNIMHLLINPAKDLDTKKFEVEAKGRIVVPFNSMKSVKDVVVLELKK
ncbi:MAG: PRC-barrel domain-containing protein [Thermoplasmata archaeon]|mgnify:CR=1 FL=1